MRARFAVISNDDADAFAGRTGEKKDRLAAAGVEEAARAIADALRAAGAGVVELASGDDVLDLGRRLEEAVAASPLDATVNLCEAWRGESRLELAVAGLLELLDFAYTGSPPLALGLCQDKALAKQVLVAEGIPTPRFAVLSRADGALPADLGPPPYFVKTRSEDASHGIGLESVCRSEKQLRSRAAYLIRTYRQDATVEAYLGGREFNVAVLGAEPASARVLPISELDYSRLPEGAPPILTYDAKWVESSVYFQKTPVICPAPVDARPGGEIAAVALAAYRALGCRDYARVDIRLDPATGAPHVLEVNPNPDLSPEAGFARSARAAEMPYDVLIRTIAGFAAARGATSRRRRHPAARAV